MGFRVAHNLISGNLIDYLELVPGYSIVETKAHTEFSIGLWAKLTYEPNMELTLLLLEETRIFLLLQEQILDLSQEMFDRHGS